MRVALVIFIIFAAYNTDSNLLKNKDSWQKENR